MKRSLYLLTGAFTLSLLGCDSKSGFTDLEIFMDEVRSRPKGTIELMPKDVIYEPFTYMAASLRSPFQPPVTISLVNRKQGSTGIQPDEMRVKQFLERFNIEDFVMVGTLKNDTGIFALIRGGDGVHRVSIGDYLGSNHGRITAITIDGIEVVEIVSDGDGGWIERPRTLALQERS